MTASDTPHAPLVLLVDDDPMVLDSLADVLAEEGYAVATATAWPAAYEIARRDRPAAIVTDLFFDAEPQGWQFVQLLLLDARTSAIPVVVISMMSDMLGQHRDRLARLGIRVLPKPFTPKDLLAALAEPIRAPRR